jgi:drug/metabolite transporter (DMT)-like permease
MAKRIKDMEFVYLLMAALSGSAQSIIGGFYNKRKASPFKYGLLLSVTVAVFFVISARFQLNFQWETVMWATFFGISYMCATVMNLLAIRHGGVPLTALVMAYSLIIPTIFAIIAYGEYPVWTFYIGLVFLMVSLFFIGVPRKTAKKQQINAKWLICIIVAFIGNGTCSLLQAHYQRLSGGLYRSEFMIIAMAIVVLGQLVAIYADRKTVYDVGFKHALMGVSTGVFNGVVNLLIMVLVGMMSSSLVFPLYSGISLVVSVIASRIFFKKNPDLLSYIAIGIGLVAIVLLNI